MTGPFRRPRVEGRFSAAGSGAWDTWWGEGSAPHIVVENNYVNVNDGVVRVDDSEIHADGLFSLGYPRDDRGQEIDARFRVSRRDLIGLRHAFQIDEYPVSGLLSGEFHLTGAVPAADGLRRHDHRQRRRLRRAVGEGDGLAALRRHRASASTASTSTRPAAASPARRSSAGTPPIRSTPTAAGFPSTASRRSGFPKRRSSGLGEFTAQGSGTFDDAAQRFQAARERSVRRRGSRRAGDADSLALRGNELSGDLDAASPRLALTGTGRIALTPQADAELTFRFHDSSLDPYVRLVRAAAVAVHDRRGQRVDSCGRRARRLRSPAGRCHGRYARPASVRLRLEERRADPHRARPARRERAGSAGGRRGHAAAPVGPRRSCATSASR